MKNINSKNNNNSKTNNNNNNNNNICPNNHEKMNHLSKICEAISSINLKSNSDFISDVKYLGKLLSVKNVDNLELIFETNKEWILSESASKFFFSLIIFFKAIIFEEFEQ